MGTKDSTPDVDGEDVRLLCLWAWEHAATRPDNSFVRRHITKLVDLNRQLFSEQDLKRFGHTQEKEWVGPKKWT